MSADSKPFKKSLETVRVKETATVTGVPVDQLTAVAQALASKGAGCIVFGCDVFAHSRGRDVVAALADVAILTEKAGKEGCGLVPVIAKNNMQGMLDMGIMPDLLPGYQGLDRKDTFEKIWGRAIPKEPGKNSEEILDGIENGSIRALYLMGCNPVQDFPAPKRWEAALKKLSWLVVQDVFPTEAADFAHYVFPAVTFAEKTGTFTSGERRVQKFTAAVEPYRNALPDWKILQMFAQHLDYPIEYSDAAMIAKEIGTVVPQYSGLRHSALSRKGSVWGPAGFEDPLFIPAGNLTLTLAAVSFPEAQGEGTEGHALVTGSALFHSGTLSTYAPGSNTLGKDVWVEVNSDDAQALGLKDGDNVTLSVADVALKAPAKVTDSVPTGVVFVPNNFRGAQVNAFLGNRNSCRVEVKKG